MSSKPPAFQFYARDWMTSHTTRRMTREERGDYIDLLSAAWISDEPGTLPAPAAIAARCAGLDTRLVANFFHKYPHIFVLDESQQPPKYVNQKLHEIWVNYKQISDKRREAANARHHANASNEQMQNGESASASSTASAIEDKKPTPTRRKAAAKDAPNPDHTEPSRQREFSDEAMRLFVERYSGEKPTWGTPDYTQLSRLLKIKPDLTLAAFSARFHRMLHSSQDFIQQQGGSLKFFCTNFDKFIEVSGGNGNGNYKSKADRISEGNKFAFAEALRRAEERDRKAAICHSDGGQ